MVLGVLFFYFYVLKDFIYSFIHERHRERGRDLGRGRSRLLTGSPMWDSTPESRDHALSQRQMLNRWATQASQKTSFRPNLKEGQHGIFQSLASHMHSVCNLQLMAWDIPAATDIFSYPPTNLWKVKMESNRLAGFTEHSNALSSLP